MLGDWPLTCGHFSAENCRQGGHDHLVNVQPLLKHLTAKQQMVGGELYKLSSLAATREHQCLLCMEALPGPHTGANLSRESYQALRRVQQLRSASRQQAALSGRGILQHLGPVVCRLFMTCFKGNAGRENSPALCHAASSRRQSSTWILY